MSATEIETLHALAEAAGIQLAYHDVTGVRREASPEAICALLKALGHAVETPADAPRALEAHRGARATRALGATLAVEAGRPGTLPVKVSRRRRWLKLELELEEGGTRSLKLELEHGEAGARFTLPADLPVGRHRLHAELGADPESSSLIVAPRRAHDGGLGPRAWGGFLPLYSLQSQRSPAVGDLSDLRALGRHLGRHGAELLGTLPLLDTFLDAPYEPSPYAPISRRFFSPLYLDLAALPEMATAPAARELLGSPEGQKALARLGERPLVDPKAIWKLERKVLSLLAASLEEGPSSRLEAFQDFAAKHPETVDYARFRAYTEARGEGFPAWPAPQRDGRIELGDVDPKRVRTHLFAQYAVQQQLARIGSELADDGVGLYLDLPIGVHPDGYDVYRERELFLSGVSAGAPPDPFFTGGQDWGFPPLSPAASSATGHAYFWACLEAHLKLCQVLRLDHVMGLHRLFVVPHGFPATEGLYLRFPREELFPLTVLATHRFQARIIGENLGTVPEEVEAALEHHGIQGMWVGQFAVSSDRHAALPEPPKGDLACLNTHDAPTFAGFARGSDIDLQEELELLTPEEAKEHHRGRTMQLRALDRFLRDRRLLKGGTTPADLAEAAYARLAASPADLLLLNLEDLWGETEPQNVPGTHLERPNWRRRASRDLETILEDEKLAAALDRIDRARHPRVSMKKTENSEQGRLTDDDLYLLGEGNHHRLYRKLGAHPLPGGKGTRFAVWAPDAEAVSVVGDFNGWEPGATPLESRGASGVWEGVVLGVGPGSLYKYHLRSRHGGAALEKADPYAFYCEEPPRSASVVWDLDDYAWSDADYLAHRERRNALDAPISIYEMHLGSWMRAEDGSWLSYREIAPRLIEHLGKSGFTHVELLPVMEHPFYGSWGYQVTGYFAASARYGTPQDLMYLIDELHQADIGVILDWVPAHFPNDEHALARFDGSHLYEHADPRLGYHPDWDTLIFNYGRNEVKSFLLSSALFWLDRYHADGLRVDAVASMLYLDYSREEGEWIPNAHGGRENLEALAFLRQLNEVIFAEHPGVQTYAEESTAWPGVSRPTYLGGVGFGLKWDMGWMHDTLKYFSEDPVHRRWHHHQLTFRGLYAFTENFALPLSHDEVVHGKGSLIRKMPGDDWQKRANLRLLFAHQWGQPGKKLLFMGGELGQDREWDHEGALQWELLDDPAHAGLLRLVGDLNRLYREQPALHRYDCDPRGFSWIEAGDADQSVYAWMRQGDPEDHDAPTILVILNATPMIREGYRVGVPAAGLWREVINTDAELYGGSGVGNLGGVEATAMPQHAWPASLTLTLPPLGALFLKRT